jgi:hypothetical protein
VIGASVGASASIRAGAAFSEEHIMSRTSLGRAAPLATAIATIAAVASSGAAAGCAHASHASGTTSVTSGTVSRVRLTATTAKDQASMRLADEICAREAACGAIRDGARYRTEEACMAEQGAIAPVQISRWSCTPTQTQEGFEECLAAIRGERCETQLARVDQLGACRTASVCGK